MSTAVTRRRFLLTTGGGVLSLLAPSFALGAAVTGPLAGGPVPKYGNWLDVYDKQWTWDSVVRSTHLVNCWYNSHCSWDVYVKDGLVYREEQAGEYPQVNEALPDFNPRGCQKGACYSERMYDPSRVRHPMKRVGERGSGRWQRVSWDEALSDIAATYLETMVEEGTDRVVWDLGPAVNFGSASCGTLRMAKLLQSIMLDMNTEIGDGHRGAAETLGKISFERSMDDYFYSDCILIWGGNPIYTHIPNIHFVPESRYNGAKVIAITPDYNPSAIKADLWVPVRSGTDAALALAVARLVIENGKVDEAFVKEQTDMPLLVRGDNGRFLNELDMRGAAGRKDHFYMFDQATGTAQVAPRRSLALETLDPALDKRARVRLHDGTEIEVTTVFSLLRERLAEYTPERASAICGTSVKMIHRFYEEIVAARALSNVTTSNLNKYYHGNLMERSIIVLFALTGNMGRKGANYSGFPLIQHDSWEKFIVADRLSGDREKDEALLHANLKNFIEERMSDGDTLEMIVHEFGRKWFEAGNPYAQFTSGQLFWAVHGGVMELAKDAQKWDPFLKQSVREYIEQAVERRDQPLQPPMGKPPRMLFSQFSNPIRRIRGSQKLLEKMWPQLKKIVVLDWRMSSSARWADYVLPVTGWYEKTDIKWVSMLMPYMHVNTQAVPAYADSMNEWAVGVGIAKHIQRLAKERGIDVIKSPQGREVRVSSVYDDVTMDGMFKEEDDEKVVKMLVDITSNVDHEQSWEDLKEKGFTRFTKLGDNPIVVGNACDVPADDACTPLTYHVEGKQPYPTQTRRIQFYIDQRAYVELDEVLPRHKEPPAIGGDHPLIQNGGHTRWSIHSAWRDSETMLRLNRGEPYIVMSAEDARSRKIKDGDWARVFNDVGSYHTRVKVSPAVRPGQTLMYHAWDDFQFRGKGNPRQVTPSPVNPVELAGNHPHLRAGYLKTQVSGTDRDTRIQVERIDGPPV